MTDSLQMSTQAIDLDYQFQNYQAADIAAYSGVIVDAANAISVSNAGGGGPDGIAVKLPAAATGAVLVGVTQETLRGTTFAATTAPSSYPSGRVRCAGPITKMIASAAITAGTIVMSDATGNGTIITQSAAKAQIGVALTTAVNSGDEVVVMLSQANNA